MLNYIKPILVLSGLFACNAGVLAAETVQLSSCSLFGSAKTRCKLEKPALLAALPEDMIASYSVAYSFPCKGHQTGLSFDAGAEKKALAYTNPDHPRNIINVDGPQSLQFIDLDPNATYRATLIGSCSLTIESVSITPSVKSITDWRDDAKDQAKIIGLSTDRYQLATDYRSYASWDKTQTQTILSSLETKVSLFDSRCKDGDQGACRALPHFKVMVGALKAKLQGSPIPSVGDDTGAELIDAYKSDLEDEVLVGNAMIERFKRWELVVSEELDKALKAVTI